MRVKLTANRDLNIPLTPAYCQHSSTPAKEIDVIRWETGAQDSGNTRTRTENIKVCGSIDLRRGVPSGALHTAILKVPVVELAIRGRLIRKEMVP